MNFGEGDKTVPYLSSKRIGNGLDYNAPNSSVIEFISDGVIHDKDAEHTGLVKSEDVRNEILTLLDLPHQAVLGGSDHQNQEVSMKVVSREPGGKINHRGTNLREAYYAKILGIDRLEIADADGNTNTQVGDIGYEMSVPGVTYAGGLYDNQNDLAFHGFSMPAEEGEFTIKFQTGNDSIDIEVLKGVGNTNPSLAIRYIDLELPPNVECLLTFSPAGVPDLRYDADGDGEFETIVPAHVRVTGKGAQDTTAPLVNVQYSQRTGQGRLITINAEDDESGVGTVYYRIGETGSFQIYTGTFHLHVPFERVVEAFADDNVGNRSSPVRSVIPAWNELP